MKSSSKLAKNTAIYAIGNFGTKILSYVMVLVYSYYITPEELGYYDVVLTTISMIQPLVIFQLNDGVFRFLIESKKEQNKAIIGNRLYWRQCYRYPLYAPCEEQGRLFNWCFRP